VVDELLDSYQHSLEIHFKALSDARAAEGLPVYALEHGLDAETLSKVAIGLKRSLTVDGRLSSHWLLWVVYATELGYDYDGEEYWPSFEQRTPQWNWRIDRRGMLRQWFHKFRKSFRGAIPTGPWATQFSIISWPITHAILPKDLQVQLARLIYDERYLIAEFIDAQPEEVGKLVAASAYEASARLRNFLEQPVLAGRIVLGLLGAAGQSTNYWLQPETIQRILIDLERHSHAKAWLRAARSTVQSAKIKLASPARVPTAPRATVEASPANEEKVALKSVTPQLLLLREEDDRWTPVVEIPSFRAIAGMNPRFATLLRSSRAKVQGTTAGWSAPGWLLYGPHKKKLAKWPSLNTSLVQLEHTDKALEYLLRSECRIEAAQCWLFRVRPDGSAAEAPSRTIHSDTQYILLYHATDSAESPFPSIHVECDGISALAVKVTSETPADALRFLSTRHLKVERHLRIWPVGTPPRRWSADGNAVWLRGETPTLALCHDADCQSLTMTLAGQPPVTVGPIAAKQPIFFGLQDLSIGSHILSVTARYSAQYSDGGQQVLTSNAALSILIRAPQEWVPGDISHRGFIVSCDQVEPTLDALLAGRLSVSIAGPRGREVNCSLELMDSSGSVLSSEPIGTVCLPAKRTDFDARLQGHLKGIEDPIHYSTASQSRLVFDGGDLGVFRQGLKHAALPLRWCIKKGKMLELRLVNDGDNELPTEITFYPFERANSPTNITAGQTESGLHPEGRHLGLEALALASIAVREDKRAIVGALPSIPGVAECAEDKVMLVEAWLRCWHRRGFWLNSMPDAWWNRGRSSGTSIQGQKSKFKAMDRVLVDANSRKLFDTKWVPSLLTEFTSDQSGGVRRLEGKSLTLRLNGDWVRCNACKSVHRPVSTLKHCLDCGSKDIIDLQPDSDIVFKARKGYYRDRVPGAY
jgi:hypothetical protein